MKKIKGRLCFTSEEVNAFGNPDDVIKLLEAHDISLGKLNQVLTYEAELSSLQAQLLHLQTWVHNNKHRVVVVFEGRDAAGKGGTIRRFIRYLNTRSMRVVALNKPTPQ